MPGILDLDPTTQGLLAAAFKGLQASGPSRTPVSIGQVVGAAGEAGLNADMAAQKAEQDRQAKDLAIKKAKLDLELQQALQGGGEGALGAMNDPDKMEAIGTRLAMAGHPGGAALVNAAQKIRAKRANESQLGTMKSVPGVQPDPQEIEQAADQGTPVPVPKPSKQGIFGSLIASPIPQIAAQAKQAQAALDAQPDAQSVTPQHWMDLQKTLAAQEATLASREALVAPNVHVVKDASSSTGWSYKDLRKGTIVSKDAPAPSTSMLNNGEVIPAKDKDLHGDDYLATLPTGMGNLVKKIASGEQSLSVASQRYGNKEALAQRVSQYDPNYSEQRFKVRQSFVDPNGKTATNITALNTVIAHMGTVQQLTSALQNGDVQAVNKLVNTVRVQTGRNDVTNAQIAIQAMGNELMRAFRQVGASEGETKQWESHFNALGGSPSQISGALKTGAELLKGRIDAVNDSWKRGMHMDTDYPDLLSPKSVGTLKRLGVIESGKPPSAQQLDDLLKKYGSKGTNG